MSTLVTTNLKHGGAAGNNALPLTGFIAEIVIASGSKVTDASRALLRDYLLNKWGL